MGEFAFGADEATVRQHNVFGDGEAEAGASGLARAGFIDAIEALEEAGEMFRGNACAEILDEKFYGTRSGTSTENDSSARCAVFQGIVYQIGKNLVNSFAIGENWWKIQETTRRRIRGFQILYLQINAVSAGNFAKALLGVVEKFCRRNGLHIKASFAGLDTGQS